MKKEGTEGRCACCASLDESFFSDLSASAREELSNQGMTMYYKKGQDIFRQGNRMEGCYCLKKGIVKTTIQSSNTKSLTLDVFSNKGVLEVSGLLNSTNVASATCLTDSELCFFPRAVFNTAIAKHSSIMNRLTAIQQDRYRQVCDLAVNLATKTAQERVADALVRLGKIFIPNSHRGMCIDVSREEISQLTGASIESVFRALAHFKKKHYIQVTPEGIIILDGERLKRIAKIKSNE